MTIYNFLAPGRLSEGLLGLLLLLLLFLCAPSALYGDSVVVTDNNVERLTVRVDGKRLSQPLRSQLEYFIEEGEELSIEDIRSGRFDKRFETYPKSLVLQGKRSYWLRFKIRNESDYNQSVILDFNEVLFWELDLYSRGFDGSFEQSRLGLSRSQLSPIRGRFYAFPIQLAAQSEQMVYSRVRTPYFVELNPYLFDSISYASDSFLRRNISNVILGMLMGVMLFLFVFVGYVRDSLDGVFYLAFVSLSGLIVATCGGYVNYIFPGNVWLNTHMYGIAVGGMLVSFIAFSRSYFNSRQTMPRVDKLLALLFYAGAIHFVGVFFFPVESMVAILMVLASICMVALLLIGPYAWWVSRQKLWVFALGNLCFISLCTLTHLSSLGIMPPATLVRHGYEFGMLAQSVFFAVGVSQKILYDRRGRQKLAMQAMMAEAESKTKSEFLAKMSHEIRTPLNGLVGMTELLKSTKLNVEQQRYIDMLQSSGENLETLLNDILDVSKMNAGQLKLDYCDVDLYDFLHKVSFPFEVMAEKKGLSLSLYYHHSLPAIASIDPTRLRQIIANLLSNAIKFTEHGSVSLSVRISDGSQPTLSFSVSDTGIGIAEDDRERLFDNFQQGNRGISRRFGGSGLGLAICRQLIELMGGAIEMASAEGGGVRFSFSLPLLPCQSSELPIKCVPEGLSQIYPGKRVLVAEDNIVNQKVVCGLLKHYKVNVDLVADGRQALTMVSSAVEDYDLIIMDCEMPVMDGFEAVEAIRSLERGGRHVIVALTAHVSSAYRQRCLAAGMDDYLTKPLHSEQLEIVLKKWLSGPNAEINSRSTGTVISRHDRKDKEF